MSENKGGWGTISARSRLPGEFLGKARSQSTASVTPFNVINSSNNTNNADGTGHETPTNTNTPPPNDGADNAESSPSLFRSKTLSRLRMTRESSDLGFSESDMYSSSDEEDIVGSNVFDNTPEDTTEDNDGDEEQEKVEVKEEDNTKEPENEDPVEKKKRQARIQRSHLANEILSTEKKYTNSLSRIITIFLLPLRNRLNSVNTKEKPIISNEEINTIFSNIEIIFNIHKTWLPDFESRIGQWSDEQRLGDIFVKMAPFLKAYTQYTNSYNTSMLAISKITKSNPAFADFLMKCLLKPACKGLNISSYLIMPIQRIPRYKLLLEQVIKYTEDSHVDMKDLQEGLKEISLVADFIDGQVKQFESQHKVLDIQNSFVGPHPIIVEPTRIFIRSATLQKISDRVVNSRSFFLFNDILIYALSITKTTFKFKKIIKLKTAKVVDLADTQRFQHLIQITTPTKKHFLRCASPQEKQDWVEDLTAHIKRSKTSLTGKSEGKDDVAAEKAAWLRDQLVKTCMHCNNNFTVTRRRHHCRKCGKIFCNDCCSTQDLSVFTPGFTKKRICVTCMAEIREKTSNGDLTVFDSFIHRE